MALNNFEGSELLSLSSSDALSAAVLTPDFLSSDRHGDSSRDDAAGRFSPYNHPHSSREEQLNILCIGCNIFHYALLGVIREFARNTDVNWLADADAVVEPVGGAGGCHLVLFYTDASDFSRVRGLVESAPERPVVVIAPEEKAGDAAAAIAAGARGYIPVRSPVEVLRCAIPLVLNGEYYLPASAFRSPRTVGPAPEESAPSTSAPVPAPHPIECPLTERQAQVLAMVAAGKSNKEIARDLHIIEGTIKLHVKAILRKLRLRNGLDDMYSSPFLV